MKYILSQKQFDLISEQVEPWIRRRLNKEILAKYIAQAIESETQSECDDFGDEFEFADAVIDSASDEFFGDYPSEDIYDDDNYSNFRDEFLRICRDEFGETLMSIYLQQCGETETD